MGFPDYFLIVWDFIRFARSEHISVGPGRGSAAGSLVAYCLRITDLDPMRYSLLFERFLNPGRKSMPDVDVDFAVAGRERVINYVAEKYGRRNVAQIITFGKMQPKAAIKDAGRVMGLPYGVVDRIAKFVPEGPKISFDMCMKPGAELRKSYDLDETTRNVVDMAMPLEGVVRNDSIHAAAVVIGDRPLTEYLPLQQKGVDSEVVDAVLDERRRGAGSAQDGLPGPAKPRRDRERGRADRAVERRARERARAAAGRPQDLRDDGQGRCHRRLPVRVERHARRAAAGAAHPVRGHHRAGGAVPARPDAEHSPLRRPPNGREQYSYPDPRLEPILSETAGISMYQEQLMLIARELGGFTPAEADDLRKAVGKKIASLMASLKDKFLKGCAENGVGAALAQQLWEDNERSADYSFNKSHAACYALISYQTAWLRANYPAEYMAALISSVMSTKDRVPFYVGECADMGIEVLPPGREREPLGLRRGRRQDPVRHDGGQERRRGRRVEMIIEARSGAAVRVDLGFLRAGGCTVLNKRMVEEPDRRRRVRLHRGDPPRQRRGAGTGARGRPEDAGGRAPGAGLDLRHAGRRRRRRVGHRDPRVHPPVSTLEWDRDDLLRREKEVLGLYVSSHPLTPLRSQLARKVDAPLRAFPNLRDGQVVTVGGIVAGVRQLVTKRATPWRSSSSTMPPTRSR